MLESRRHQDRRAHKQERNQLLPHFVVLTEPGNGEHGRETLREEEERPSYGLIECAGLEVAEGRVVDEVDDGDKAIHGVVDDDEGSTEEAREDIFVVQPVTRFQHELIGRGRPRKRVGRQRHWLGDDGEDCRGL